MGIEEPGSLDNGRVDDRPAKQPSSNGGGEAALDATEWKGRAERAEQRAAEEGQRATRAEHRAKELEAALIELKCLLGEARVEQRSQNVRELLRDISDLYTVSPTSL